MARSRRGSRMRGKTIIGAYPVIKLLFFNKIALEDSGGARTGFGRGSAFGIEITVKGVYGCIQNQMAIGASFEMTFDLDFDGL
jgi:hypothetical protein